VSIHDNTQHSTHIILNGFDRKIGIRCVGYKGESDKHVVSIIRPVEIGSIGWQVGLDISGELCFDFGDKRVNVVIAIRDGECSLRIGGGTTSQNITKSIKVVIDLLKSIGNRSLFHEDFEIVMGIL
jgi:hypothetical protein